MQHYWWKKSRSASLLTIAAILSACSNEHPAELQSGTYLPDDIQVSFQMTNEGLQTPPSSEILIKEITEQLTQSYFTIEAPVMTLFINGEESQGIITPENIVLSQLATLQLNPQPDGTILISSNDHTLCQKNRCDIQFTLIKTADDDPKLLTLKNPTLDTPAAISEAAPVLPSINLPTLFTQDFWGVEHEISDDIHLKLSPIQSNGLTYGVPEYAQMAAFDLGDITINPEDPAVEILSFYSNAEPSSDVHQIDTISYLFILPMDKAPTLNLAALDTENPHYYADHQNLLANDMAGLYAVQYRYFPEIKRLVVALTESLSLEEIQPHLQAIDTLSPFSAPSALVNVVNGVKNTQKNQDSPAKQSQIIRLTDINEPLKTLEARYEITLAEMFREDEITDSYQQAVKALLTSPDLFLKTGPTTQNGYHLLTLNFGDYRFNETYLKIHNDSLQHVMTAVKALNNLEDNLPEKHNNQPQDAGIDVKEDQKGLWKAPIYLYSINPTEASGISYFKELQPGVTLEIFSPAFQGHIAEKVLFAKLLEKITWKNLPKLSKNAISNIAKYQAIEEAGKMNQDLNAPTKQKTDSPAKFYQFKEGKTDLQGVLQKEK